MDVLAQRFEDSRPHLAAVAYRMLGSRAEADDAVQEAWLRLARTDVDGVDNLRGWLTTVVSRVCLDMLRSRTSRREDPLDATTNGSRPRPGRRARRCWPTRSGRPCWSCWTRSRPPSGWRSSSTTSSRCRSTRSAPSSGARPPAAGRGELAQGAGADEPVEVRDGDVGPGGVAAGKDGAAGGAVASARSADVARGAAGGVADPAARALRPVAGRMADAEGGAAAGGRHRVPPPAAATSALLELLDPEAVVLADAAAVIAGAEAEVRGAAAVAATFVGRAKAARLALLDGEPGLIWTHRGEVRMAFAFTVLDGRVAGIELIADPARIAAMGVEPLA